MNMIQTAQLVSKKLEKKYAIDPVTIMIIMMALKVMINFCRKRREKDTVDKIAARIKLNCRKVSRFRKGRIKRRLKKILINSDITSGDMYNAILDVADETNVRKIQSAVHDVLYGNTLVPSGAVKVKDHRTIVGEK